MLLNTERPYLALGLEGSANKLGAGVIRHEIDGSSTVLSNIRHTYITPPGDGFLPRDTAAHHRQWALKVIEDAIAKSGITIHNLDCICYTKGESQSASSATVQVPRPDYVDDRARHGGSAAISCASCSDTLALVR